MQYLPCIGRFKGAIEAAARWQQSILEVMTLLPGAYPYVEVERAIRESGVHPQSVYLSLAANRQDDIMQRFYQALRKEPS